MVWHKSGKSPRNHGCFKLGEDSMSDHECVENSGERTGEELGKCLLLETKEGNRVRDRISYKDKANEVPHCYTILGKEAQQDNGLNAKKTPQYLVFL